MEKVFFIGGSRTAFGAFGGSLKDKTGTDLSEVAAIGALKNAGVTPEQIEHIVIGNVVPSSSDGAYLPRHLGLRIGIPVHVPAFMVNRLCGSGFQSWVHAAQMMNSGEAQLVLAGGAEQMSQVPYVNRKIRFEGLRMGNAELEDQLTSSLTDAYAKMPMAMTAENLGEKFGITREQCDEYSFETQQKCKAALDKKLFVAEISAVTVQTKKGELVIDKDEHPKPDVSLEKIRSLKALFKPNGLVTAATSSGIVDGAACSVLASESKVKELGLKPLARMVAYASVGCDPKMMGYGPVPAIKKVLQQANLKQSQIDLFEVNEAFAAQFLAVRKDLDLPADRTNVNGGAIAIGHPLGASGTRIMNHLVLEMHRRGVRYGIGSACIGGGQGIALLVERII